MCTASVELYTLEQFSTHPYTWPVSEEKALGFPVLTSEGKAAFSSSSNGLLLLTGLRVSTTAVDTDSALDAGTPTKCNFHVYVPPKKI